MNFLKITIQLGNEILIWTRIYNYSDDLFICQSSKGLLTIQHKLIVTFEIDFMLKIYSTSRNSK